MLAGTWKPESFLKVLYLKPLYKEQRTPCAITRIRIALMILLHEDRLPPARTCV
jgi:hypothetical protein